MSLFKGKTLMIMGGMGSFYRAPCVKRGLNYDKYFRKGDTVRNTLTELNSHKTELLSVEHVKEKLTRLESIRQEIGAQ